MRMKVQAHSSLEPPLGYNLVQTPLMNRGSLRPFSLHSFRLVQKEKTSKEIPMSSRLEFLEKILANNFALSDAEDNTSGPLNRGSIADLFLLRALLAICQES